METEDVVLVAANAVDNLGAPEPLNLAGGGRNENLDSGPPECSDVEYKEKTLPEEGAVGLGATRNIVLEDGEKKGEGGRLVLQRTAESMEPILELEQMPSGHGGVSNVVQDMVIDTVTEDAETEAEHEAQAGLVQAREKELTDSLMKDVAKEAATDISSPVEEGGDGMMKNLDNLTAIQESQKEADRYRIASSSIAEVLAAGVAAGVAEGIAESIAETIAKETAGLCGQAGSMEGRLFDSGRFERMAIAKAVAEVIAESVAQEVAQGLADGLAEAAGTVGTAEAFNGVEKRKPDNNIQGMGEGNKDGVVCECGLVAVVRVVGEKSPNRGLRYLMCSRQEPSFFKRKGKRKDSDTIGKCKFFRWLDTPRHPSKEDKKNQEKVKAQLEDLNTSHLTRSSAKKTNLESPTAAGTRPSGFAGEVSPSEIPTPTVSLQLPEVPESTPELKEKPTARKQRKRGLAEESGRDDPLVAERPTSAGTLTRSALRKGAGPEPVQEPSLDTSAVSTPASTLGKRTIDWTDTYVGPESQVFEKGATWRKRRSVRGENGPSSRYSIGGRNNSPFGSSEKKPLHYFRRSTGQVGAVSDGEPTIHLLSSSPNPLTDVESGEGAGYDDTKDIRFKSYYKKGKVSSSSLEPKSAAEEIISPVETEKRTKSQTRRQQRKLPLSEVYGAMEPLPPVKATKKGNDNSLSPSGQSFGKSTTPSDVASEPKDGEHFKSPPKKRKLSWVFSEDSVLRESDSSYRASARKSSPGAHTNSGSPMIETPLLASVFPTVRYEAKLPAEDYHDPDDPWSLEIPWAKQEHHEPEKAQQLERENETCENERNGEAEEGENIVMAMNEDAATEEELPKESLNAAQELLSVSESGEFTGSQNSGDVPGPVSLNMNPNEAREKDYDNPELHMDQGTINAVVDTGTSLVDAVDGGESVSFASASQAVGAHADGQEVGDVLKEDLVETQHEVLPDEQTLGDETQTSMLAAQTGTQLEADGHESLMSEAAIMELPGSIDESDHSAPDKTDSTAPLEQLPINESVELFTHDRGNVGEAITEDVVNREDNNLLLESVPTVSKNTSSSKLDETMETDTVLPGGSSEPLGTDAEVTIEREPLLSGDQHGTVKGTDGSLEEPAVSGSNLIADDCPDARVGFQVSNHGVTERDLPHTPLDQDHAAFKSPRETDHTGAAAGASENAGFVNSVWRLASGKKTRSIGSIGAPAVTSKRSRSAVKGGPKGDLKHQVDVQWVDVPLDWRNEKSTGRVPLLPNFFGKSLNGSDTSHSDLRLLQQSGDTSQGTRGPKLARGEVDDSSIITDEKDKGLGACNEASTDFDAQIVANGAAAYAGQASTLRNATAMVDEASVPAGDEHYLVEAPTNQQQAVFAGEENAVQKRKRGRPRKDSKKPVGAQYPVAGGLTLGAAVGANQNTPEPELAEVVGKADGEPSSMILCSTAMEGNTLTELHGEDRVSQLERSASNTEKENGKPEAGGGSIGPEERGRPLDGSDFPSASTEGLHSEIAAPYCSCKVFPRQAILKTVTRSGDPNEGLRYWSCSNKRKLFTKKRKSPSEVTEESCTYFRWLDTPRVTATDKREARKERYRQVELQRLL